MLIRSVESFLSRHAISASQFGREAAHDPRLVYDLRAGRAPRPPLDQRVRGFMDGFELARGLAPDTTRAGAPRPSRTPAEDRKENHHAR